MLAIGPDTAAAPSTAVAPARLEDVCATMSTWLGVPVPDGSGAAYPRAGGLTEEDVTSWTSGRDRGAGRRLEPSPHHSDNFSVLATAGHRGLARSALWPCERRKKNTANWRSSIAFSTQSAIPSTSPVMRWNTAGPIGSTYPVRETGAGAAAFRRGPFLQPCQYCRKQADHRLEPWRKRKSPRPAGVPRPSRRPPSDCCQA